MRNFIRSLLGILSVVFFLTLVSSTLNYAQSTEHNWVPGDMVWVDHLCANSEILKISADLMKQATDESVKQAEDLWKLAVTSGVCVSSPENFLIRLVTMIEHFPNLFGAEGYHGELWFATTILPDGTPLQVYAGVIAKPFASKHKKSSGNNIQYSL